MKKSVMNSNRFNALLVIVLLSFTSFGYCRERKWETPCPSISVGTVFSVIDGELGVNNYVSTSNRAYVELKIDDYAGPFFWYTAKVDMSVRAVFNNYTYGQAYNITLTVENNHYGGFGNFIDLQKHLVNTPYARGVEVTITGVSIVNNEATAPDITEVPGNLRLSASFESTRFYQLDVNEFPNINVVQNPISNTIDFTWNNIATGVEEYELEWTWVDNYSDQSVLTILDASQIAFNLKDFDNNNTRIQTSDNHYSIANLYDRGYLIYRIRNVGRFISNHTSTSLSVDEIVRHNLYGKWSGQQSPNVISDWDYIALDGHRENLNWQFQTSYAEQGKKKEIASYFDGSLRNRQTVTKVNSNEKAIVGEVIYDNEGRPAIEVLPSPVNSSAIDYYPQFNRNTAGDVYSYQDFVPLNDADCNTQAGEMSISSGASQYYSDNTTHQGNNQDFVPKAESYPFSQTVYENDNTGRIKRKGGVGSEFKISSGHEMKYFYTVPAQEELNRLFGYYVGNAMHYKKNAVLDPNGQLSVSYLDPQGRTIATALAADTPPNMTPLEDDDGTATRAELTEDLLNKLHSTDFDTDLDNNIKYRTGTFGNLYDGLRYDARKVLTASSSLYTFNYTLNNQDIFNFGCDNINPAFQVNYPFVYKLHIDVKNECGVSQIAPVNISLGVNPDGSITTSASPVSTTQSFGITPTEPATYSVSKNLTVDANALEIFTEDYIKKAIENGCILQKETAHATFEGCFTSCQDCANHYLNMTYNSYIGQNAYVHQMLDTNCDLNELAQTAPNSSNYQTLLTLLTTRYEREWLLLKDDCMRPCNNTGISSNTGQAPTTSIACSALLSQIVADVMPGGQYANSNNSINSSGDVSSNPNPVVIDDLPLSVYNETTANHLIALVPGLEAPSITGVQNNINWRHPNYFNKDNFPLGTAPDALKHYYDENGQIDYVTLTQDDQGNFSPEVLVIPTRTPNGEFKVEPQYLKNVSDFLAKIQTKPSWALSLIKYHPEFHYIEYQLEYCKASFTRIANLANVNYNVNSDGFDAILGSAETYQEAKDRGFLNRNNPTVLAENDPFFQIVHPLDGFSTAISGTAIVQTPSTPSVKELYRQHKLSIIYQALAKTSPPAATICTNDNLGFATGIGEQYVTIARSAYELIRCTGIGPIGCSDLPAGASFQAIIDKVDLFEESEKDRFWQNYLSSYVGLKQTIKDTFINLYAARNGGYNDCIGNTAGADISNITHSIAERYPCEKNFVTAQLNATPLVTPNSCSVNGLDLVSKAKRFIFQESISTNGSNASSGQANSGYFTQTGICPMVRDLEIFLDSSSKRTDFASIYRGTTPSTQPFINYITPYLLTEMGGVYNQTLITSGTIATSTPPNKIITLNFSQNSSPLKSITLIIPNTSSSLPLTWNNYGIPNQWKIVKMSNVTATNYDANNQVYNFKVLAKIIAGTTSFESVFDGYTPIRLTCTTGPQDPLAGNPIVLEPLEDNDCDKKQNFADALKSMMQILKNTNHLFAFTPYTLTLPSYLRTYFGVESSAHTATWQVLETGIGGAKKFKLSVIKSGSQVDTGIVIYRNSQTNTYSTATNSIIGLSIGNTDDVENVHVISVNFGTASFEGYIHRFSAQIDLTTGLNFKPKMYFACCSSCGEYDYDADGIGDDGIFALGSCDFCDNRIDINNDGVGDCLSCSEVADFDCDGILNGLDNCPLVYNPQQENTGDTDTFGNACDLCPTHNDVVNIDTDGDGLGDRCDPCPNGACPSCFQGEDKEIFETTFRNLLNEIVSTPGFVNINTGNYENMSSHLAFYTDFQMQQRCTGANTVQVLYGCNIHTNEFSLDKLKFSYSKNIVNFPLKLRWRKDSTNPNNELSYFQFELNFNSFLNGNVSSITEVIVNEPTSSSPYGLIIKGYYNDADNGSTAFELAGQLRIKFVSTASSECYFEDPLCQFVDDCDLCRTQSGGKNVVANYKFSETNSLQSSCPCIPHPPLPVACSDAYTLFMNTMTTTFGANNDEVTYFTNKQDYFCNHNLKYLVSGYLQYLSVLGITSTSDPRYIAIDTFGATGLNYGYESYGTVIAAYHNYLITPHEGETLNWRDFVSDYLSHHPEICPPAPMAPTQSIPVPFPTQTTCQQFSLNVSETYNDDNYQAYLNSKKQAFKTEYLRQALEKVNETFTMSYTDREYQYTLYYYDQAGNLMQTVAPQGVTIVPSSYNQEIDQVRIDNEVAFLNNSLLPFNQKFQTKYRYNSLNQLVWQSTPDGGETRFAYDELGRIVASQNSKQGNLATLAKTSFELSPYIGTKENVIYNVGKNIPIKEAYGISKETIADYGTISYSVPSSVNSLEYNSLCNVILGLTYKKENLGQIYYGFIHDCQGNVSIKTLETISEIIPVAEGNVLYITREDGYIRFFKDEQLLKEVVEESYGKLMYVNFYLPQAKTSISNINIGYTKPGRDFSYTCYDPLGRINEAGQFTARQTLRINDDGKLVYNNNQSWVPVSAIINYPHNVSNNQIEVTKTVYDSYGPFSESVHQLSTSSSNSTRNRVTAILTYDICDLNWPLEKYDTAIFYSYDIHGNVNEMTQRISPSIIAAPQYPEGIIKKVNYEYDLISGNVNKVYYQKGNLFKDQFIHKYNYDADNRITSVETSRDGEIWEKDASYEYYEHGPLARVITGDKKVQGTDYAYTLQGWLKTVNSENLSTNTKDMGSDGNYVSKDAFGYSLSYFNNDYSARQPGTNNAHAVSSNSAVNQGTNLYNGNIKRMITSLRGLDEQIMPTQINLYSYDQLNRIFAMNSFKGIETSGELNLYNSYKSNYTYDKNGNLKTLHRDAPRLENNDDPNSEQIVSMDRFEYKYKPLTNKLRYIKDETDLTNLFEEDIDDQRPNNEPESNYNADNYKYDAIGQLISDKAENIEKISWRVDGKVKSIQKFSGEYFINFFYDGLGNRVAKQVSMGRAGTSSTHYTRDAQGNTMAVYDLRLNPERRAEYNLKEHHIYGSSRLGLQEYEIYKNPLNFHRLVGDKRYELSNHLGNVLNVISDRKIVNRKTKTILVDTFEDDLGWIAFNESDVFINKQRELQITIVPNENNLMSGALKKLKFQENETVMFNLEVKRENDLSAITPINFEIRDIYDKNVLWSSLVPANGIVSGSFTPTISNEYYVSITALPAAENEITFTVDNFYAYVLPPSPTDYVSLFQPDVLAYNDYYPFGSLVPNRHGSTADYRYGFQGQEKDDEIKGGEGNSLDFGERMYDPRIGRWFKIDPDDSKYPQFSPYLFASNNPIFLLDFDGRGPIIPKSWWQGKPQYAFFAGMVDEAWDTSKSLWDSAVELFWLSENTQEWEKRYGKIRREQYNAVVTIFNNEKARDALIIELYAKTGIYINTLAGGNGDDKAEYEKGKLAFQGLTAVIGLSEINAFIKTGSFTDDALKLIAKSGKYKPCGCFVSGTLVYTEEGYKNIEDIKVGDKVWAHDDVTENLALKKVIDTFTREFTQVYKIYFGDEVLEVTHEHPFFIGGKWLKVDELKKGNLLTLYDGTTKAISKIELVEGNFKVYNFTVDEFHTYYVSKQNVLVHNGNPCPWNKLKSESLTVVSYGYKHYVKNVKAAWKNIVSSTKNGPSKFKGSTEKVDDLIKTAWDNGKEVNNGKTWKVYEANDIIGAVSGKETKYMRVELTESTKEVHASPISEADYLKYTK